MPLAQAVGMPITYEEKHHAAILRIPVNWQPYLNGATITQSEWVDRVPGRARWLA
jgi:hypothetical protein